MPTVLVPLDETAFAESILPDAQQLAGPSGRHERREWARQRRLGGSPAVLPDHHSNAA